MLQNEGIKRNIQTKIAFYSLPLLLTVFYIVGFRLCGFHVSIALLALLYFLFFSILLLGKRKEIQNPGLNPYRRMLFFLLAMILWGGGLLTLSALGLWFGKVVTGANLVSSLGEIAFLIFALLIILFFATNRFFTQNDLRLFSDGWILTTFTVCILALIEYFLHIYLWAPVSIVHGMAIRHMSYAVVSFGNPNDLAAFLALSFPWLLISYFTRNATPQRNFLFTIITILMVTTLLISGGRISIFATIIAMTIFALFFLDLRIFFSPKVILSVLILSVFMGYFLVFGHGLFLIYKSNAASTGKSLSIRLDLIAKGLFMSFHSFFMGVGPNGFTRLMTNMISENQTLYKIASPHNIFIQLLVNYGLIIILMFFSILLSYLKIALKVVETIKDPIIKKIAGCDILSIILLVLVSGEPSSFFKVPYFWYYLSGMTLLNVYLLTQISNIDKKR